MELAIRAENSNVHAIQFLDDFESWVERQLSEGLTASAVPWITTQRATRFAELRETAYDSSGPMIALVLERKDVEFLEKM